MTLFAFSFRHGILEPLLDSKLIQGYYHDKQTTDDAAVPVVLTGLGWKGDREGVLYHGRNGVPVLI